MKKLNVLKNKTDIVKQVIFIPCQNKKIILLNYEGILQ